MRTIFIVGADIEGLSVARIIDGICPQEQGRFSLEQPPNGIGEFIRILCVFL